MALANGVISVHPDRACHVYVEHDAWCAIYKASQCNCSPDINYSDGDTVTAIDAQGRGEPRRKC